MIRIRYQVANSTIPQAGRGLFASEALEPGRIIVAPSGITDTCSLAELMHLPADHILARTSVRWFEDCCSLAQEWPDQCCINHSFTPNSIWHLGFTIAIHPIQPGEEITMDYRHLLGDGVDVGFCDALSGRPIIGFPWRESMRLQLVSLSRIFQN